MRWGARALRAVPTGGGTPTLLTRKRCGSCALSTVRPAAHARTHPAQRGTPLPPLLPSPRGDVTGGRRGRTRASERHRLPLAPSPQVTSLVPDKRGAGPRVPPPPAPHRRCRRCHRAPTRGDAIRPRRTVKGQGARAEPQRGRS